MGSRYFSQKRHYSTTGFVNNQTGNTAYTTLPSDYGAYLLFSDASPVALTLSTSSGGIQLPWYCIILNEGVGLVTATPATGTISYPNNISAASMPIAQGQAAVVVYDGTNFYGAIIPVATQNTPSVSHEWLNSYNSITGEFTQTQPSFSDISGIAQVSQGGTGTATPSLIAGSNVTVTGSWPNQTISASGGGGGGFSLGENWFYNV